MWRVKTAGNRAKKNIPRNYHGMSNITGGWGGIRTPGSLATSAVFKTVAFDRSATHPKLFSTDLSNRRGFGLRGTSFRSTSLRSQDRRIRPRLSPILNFFRRIFQTDAVLVCAELRSARPRFAVKTVAFDRGSHPS